MPYIKESLINISSMYSISAPILLIFFLDRWREIVGAWVALGAVTLLYPPTFGWLRPHRHSDKPGNRGGFGGLKE